MILNLIRPEKSGIKYKIFTFPDGEPHIQIEMNDEVRKEGIVEVRCRITNPTDLFILQLTLDVLNRHKVETQVVCYYLMSQRMDRIMDFNRPYSLEVVLNSILPKVSNIIILDPHFYYSTIESLRISRKVSTMDSRCIRGSVYDKFSNIIFPDKSARDRFGLREGQPYGIKKRDVNTGNIIGFELVDIDNIEDDKEILVYDDLCDGGYTFKLVADELEKLGLLHRASIYVTHAVNPKGIELMRSLYKTVYITNSYADYKSEGNLHVINVC